jgi:hypothetical protein
MNTKSPITLAIAIFSIALLYSRIDYAQNQNMTPDAVNPQAVNPQPSGTMINPNAQQTAMQMVPAHAELIGTLDAKKMQRGQEFRAALSSAVHLKNGTDLPRGTQLVGTVGAEATQQSAPALVLNFTKAELKSGTVVPITATIVGIAPPPDYTLDAANTDTLNDWDNTTLQFDQVDESSGVKLLSEIGDSNSGVLFPTKKDVKLSSGSQLALVICAQEGGAQNELGRLQ